MNYITEYAASRHQIEHQWHDPQLVFQLSLGWLERQLRQRDVRLFVLASCDAILQDGSFCIDSQAHGFCDIVIDAKQIRQTANLLGCTLRETAESAVLHEVGHILAVRSARLKPDLLPDDPLKEEVQAWGYGEEMATVLGVSVPYGYRQIRDYFLSQQSSPIEKQSTVKLTAVEAKRTVDAAIAKLERQVRGETMATESLLSRLSKMTEQLQKQVNRESRSVAARVGKVATPEQIIREKAKRLGIALLDHSGELALDKDRVSANIPASVLCFG